MSETSTPYLEREQEALLIQTFQEAARSAEQAADPETRDRLKQQADDAASRLLASQERAIRTMAERYRAKNPYFISREELISAGYEGFMDALTRFDSSRGVRLVTYASSWIQNRMVEEIKTQKWLMGISDYTYKQIVSMMKGHESFIRENNREPSEAELSDLINMPVEKIRNLNVWKNRDVLSLDDYQGNSDESPLSKFASYYDAHDMENSAVEKSAIWSDVRTIVKQSIGKLNARDKAILGLHFGLDGREPAGIPQIAQQLGVSRERVRQLLNNAKAKLMADQSLKARAKEYIEV